MCNKDRRNERAYVAGTVKSIGPFASQCPFLVLVLLERNAEQRLGLWQDPGIPLSLESRVVHQRGIPTLLPHLVVLLGLGEVTVGVDVVGEHESTSFSRVPEVGGASRGEGADELGCRVC